MDTMESTELLWTLMDFFFFPISILHLHIWSEKPNSVPVNDGNYSVKVCQLKELHVEQAFGQILYSFESLRENVLVKKNGGRRTFVR